MLRGVLDLCVLALLEHDTVYGYEVAERLAAQGLQIGEGSVYPLLGRLQKAGLVSTEFRPGVAGPPRRYYAITRAGRTALDEGRLMWADTSAAVNVLLQNRKAVRPGRRKELVS